MRASMILKMLLSAAMFTMFAADEDTASAASTTDAATADTSAANAPAADASTTGAAPDADTTTAAGPQTASSDADSTAETQASAPIVQTPTPVAQPGNEGDSVLETVKTPAHNVAEEIEAEIKKLEQLPPEVAAWFKSKFVELSTHIKALL